MTSDQYLLEALQDLVVLVGYYISFSFLIQYLFNQDVFCFVEFLGPQVDIHGQSGRKLSKYNVVLHSYEELNCAIFLLIGEVSLLTTSLFGIVDCCIIWDLLRYLTSFAGRIASEWCSIHLRYRSFEDYRVVCGEQLNLHCWKRFWWWSKPALCWDDATLHRGEHLITMRWRTTFVSKVWSKFHKTVAKPTSIRREETKRHWAMLVMKQPVSFGDDATLHSGHVIDYLSLGHNWVG